MFWGKRLFKKQYFVAISLFDNIQYFRIAKIDYRQPNFYGTYAIKCGKDGGNCQLGWAHVNEHASATAYWNDQMRDKRLSFAIWEDGMLFHPWEGRPRPDPKKLQDVQLCVVFEAHTKYEREAANEAWTKLISGNPAHIEWYDASPDKKWTKMFRPRS